MTIGVNKSIIWAMVARFAAIALFFDGMEPLLPEIARSFSLKNHDFQKILGLSFSAFAAMQLLSVYVIGQLGLYRCILFSSLAVSLSALLLCMARETYSLIIIFILMFAVNSIGSNATRIALRNLTSDAEFKRYFSWANAIIQIKQILVPAVEGATAMVYGWRWALFVLVFPVVVVSLWLGSMDKDRMALLNIDQATVKLFAIQKLFKEKKTGLSRTILSLAAFHVCFAYTTAWFAFILANDMAISVGSVGILFSLASGLIALSFLLSASLSARYSDEFILAIGVGSMICASLALFIGHGWLLIVGILLLYFSYGFITVPCTANIMNTELQYRTLASAILGFTPPLAGGLSVLLLGFINYDVSPIVIMPYLIAIAALLIMMLMHFLTDVNKIGSPHP